jgi:hypothetical protein
MHGGDSVTEIAVAPYEVFIERFAHFSGRRSVGGTASESSTIGCVLLRDSVFFDDSVVIDLDETGEATSRG